MSEQIPPLTTHIFIDESGDLGKFGSGYFVIVALATHEPLPIAKIIKNARKKFLGKKEPEFKGSNSNDRIRRYVLNALGKCDCHIYVAAIPKHEILEELFENKNQLYKYLCGILFGFIDLNTRNVRVVIDKKDNNRFIRESFNKFMSEKIRARSKGIKIEIHHLDSFASNELLAVDFIAWAVNRYLTHKESRFYDLIRHRIRDTGCEWIWKN